MDRMPRDPFSPGAGKSPNRSSGRGNVVPFPLVRGAGDRPGASAPEPAATRVSQAEIAHLVSIALADALDALEQADPEGYLRVRACDARTVLRKALGSARPPGPGLAEIAAEYRKAVVFQKLSLNLALKLIGTIRQYTKVREREVSDALAE